MALLTGPEIRAARARGDILIEPWDEARLNPNSYDLSLAPHLILYKKVAAIHHAYTHGALPSYMIETAPPLDMAVDEEVEELTIPPEGLVLYPGVFYLGCTQEYTETRGYAPIIEGRSSLGRLGCAGHITAGVGDDGFCGTWTCEITVVYPLRVYAGVPLCQVMYHTLCGERRLYDGRYQGQRGPRASGLWKHFLPYP